MDYARRYAWCTLVWLSVACGPDPSAAPADTEEEDVRRDGGDRGRPARDAATIDGSGGRPVDAGSASRSDASRDAGRAEEPAEPVEAPSNAGSADAMRQLEAYLAMPRANRAPIAEQSFATLPLTKGDAAHARELLWTDFADSARTERAAEVGASASVARTIRLNGLSLRYYLARRGVEPTGGRSLFISMHGGGSAPAATNDSQWQNQIALVDGYAPEDAVWVAPRAPIDDWNMWFIEGIDALFERLIADMIVFEGVNPNKVYLTGYSAGGDGVYQLGPRMADRWAGAGMSAGHPNSASPLNLRNLAFAIHVGGNDTAFERNQKAREWGMRLEQLAAADPGGYAHQWEVHAGLPHWMELADAVSIPFLQEHVRDPIPREVVWEQAEVTRASFYWLAVDAANRRRGTEVRASYDEQGVQLELAEGVTALQIRLSDEMLDLDRPVRITHESEQLFAEVVPRTIRTLAQTLVEREDPSLMFCAEVRVELL